MAEGKKLSLEDRKVQHGGHLRNVQTAGLLGLSARCVRLTRKALTIRPSLLSLSEMAPTASALGTPPRTPASLRAVTSFLSQGAAAGFPRHSQHSLNSFSQASSSSFSSFCWSRSVPIRSCSRMCSSWLSWYMACTPCSLTSTSATMSSKLCGGRGGMTAPWGAPALRPLC